MVYCVSQYNRPSVSCQETGSSLCPPRLGAAGESTDGEAGRREVRRRATEREGFEPSDEVDPRHAISSRARSTTPAPLRAARRVAARPPGKPPGGGGVRSARR